MQAMQGRKLLLLLQLEDSRHSCHTPEILMISYGYCASFVRLKGRRHEHRVLKGALTCALRCARAHTCAGLDMRPVCKNMPMMAIMIFNSLCHFMSRSSTSKIVADAAGLDEKAPRHQPIPPYKEAAGKAGGSKLQGQCASKYHVNSSKYHVNSNAKLLGTQFMKTTVKLPAGVT